MRLGHAGVPAHVLETFGESEQERIEHLARKKDLARAVPADLETHPAESLFDGLEGGTEYGLLDLLEVVGPG